MTRSMRRRDLLIGLAALLVVIPSALLLLLSLLAGFAALSGRAMGGTPGFAILGLIFFPIPSILLLSLEFLALVRRRPGAASLVSNLGFFATIYFPIPLGIEILGLMGLRPDSPKPASWLSLGVLSTLLACVLVIAVGHRRLSAVLRTEKRAKPREDWDTIGPEIP